MACAQIHGFATIFDQSRQQAGLLGIQAKRLEPIQMLSEEFQKVIDIQRIVFILS
jgi:hypothetical protein